jgi:hypothetical protein
MAIADFGVFESKAISSSYFKHDEIALSLALPAMTDNEVFLNGLLILIHQSEAKPR